MGYCYTVGGKLVCDRCDKAGGVRKRTCPHKVYYYDGTGALPYCQPAALCSSCYQIVKATLHAGCEAAAVQRSIENMREHQRLLAGDARVVCRFGDWDADVPTGYVRAIYRDVQGTETDVLYPSAVPDTYTNWLSDLPC
jgi:hypothetical protein